MARWLTPGLLFAGILLGLALLLSQSASRGSFADAGSTYRAAEDGSRALYLLAEASGLPVTRRHLDLNLVDHEGAIVLVGIGGGSTCRSAEETADLPIVPSIDEASEEEGGDDESSDGDDADPDAEDASEPEEQEVVVGPSPGLGMFGAQLSSEECAALLTWVEDGGNLIHVTDHDDALLARLGLRVRPPIVPSPLDEADPDAEPPGTVEAPVDEGEGEETPPWEKWLEEVEEDPATAPKKDDAPSVISFLPRKLDAEGPLHRLIPGQPSVFSRKLEGVVTTGESRIETERGDAIAVLVDDETPLPGKTRGVAAAAVPHGEGWVLAVSVPELTTNRTLPEAQNATFWLNAFAELAAEGTVAFDEYHHGHAAGRTILGYALEHGLLPALLQLMLLVIVGVLAGRRLGRIERLPGETLRSTADHLATMANLYRLGGHRRHAAVAIGRRALAESSRYRSRPEVEAAAGDLEAQLSRVELSKPSERELSAVATAAAALYQIIHRKKGRPGGRKRGRHAA